MSDRGRLTETGGSTAHKAGWVLADTSTVIRDGYVETAHGVVRSVGRGRIPSECAVVDHGPGVIMPSLINAHTHLELSALKGKLPLKQGFRHWVRQLLNEREAAGTKTLCIEAARAITELKASGCCAVGDISTLGLTRDLISDSGLAGVWFQEYLGNINGRLICDPVASGPAAVSLAGHAPHTTSPELLVHLKQAAGRCGLPFSIHLAESEDEIDFLTTGRGQWADFLNERGIDFSGWPLPVKSPVRYLDVLGLLDSLTIAVHLIDADARDLDILCQNRVRICLCPRSNHTLHQRLPDIEKILSKGLAPCLGTDSLAGVDSLSMFDEMAYTADCFPAIPPAGIIEAATINGAEALGISKRYGTLNKGKQAQFIYVPVSAANSAKLFETLVHTAAAREIKICGNHKKRNEYQNE